MSYKLLLADDSVTIQRVIELTFADEDVQVIAVGDGQVAMDRIELDRPDIVLADVGMPGRDGYEVAAFVKTAPHLAHIPVLLLTGAFEPVDEDRARAVGCDGVLAKPFEPQMVITRVKELLAASGRAPLAGRPEPAAPAGEAVMQPAQESGGGSSPAVELDLASLQDSAVAAALAPAAPQAGEEAGGPDQAGGEAGGDEAAGEAGLRIHRRPPVAVPDSGEAGPAGVGEAAGASPLDDYFDRLDAAFATLGQAPGPAGDQPAQPGSPLTAADILRGSGLTLPGQSAAGAPLPHAPGGGTPEGGDEAPHPPVLARAFSALLAVESGSESPADVAALWGPPAVSEATIDELAERVAGMVLERLTDRVVRETVADIVSRVTERLVREEIERVKAMIK